MAAGPSTDPETDPKGRRSKRGRIPGTDASETRKRVLEAAVACILEKGYYHASSNEIARWAGLTWGVIQYHFGTRERLMLEVMKYQIDKLAIISEAYEFSGESAEEQLWSIFEFLRQYFGDPAYIAALEVNLNLVRTPSISDDVRKELGRLGEIFERVMTENSGHAVSRPFVTEVLRGVILSHQLRADSALTTYLDEENEFRARVAALIKALAWHIDTGQDDPPSTHAFAVRTRDAIKH